jgi:hypothetical protein
MQIVYASHWLSLQRNDDVPGSQTRSLGWTVLFHGQNQCPTLSRQLVKADNSPMDGNCLPGNPNIAPANAPIAQQTAGDKFRSVNPDRKANPLRWQNRRCIHPDHTPLRIHQRPT